MFLLAVLSALAALCIIVPAPFYSLLPLTVAAPELSPWLVLFNLMCCALALRFWRRSILIFFVSLLICSWPVYETRKLDGTIHWIDCFRGIETGTAQPEVLPLNIRFYPPEAPGPRPGIVSIYGGAWQRGKPSDDAQFNRYWAARGYSVFAIDYRHAPAAKFPAQIEDVRAAMKWIRANGAQYRTDASRLVLCGRSSGGQLALLAAYQEGVPVRGVIAFYPPTDLIRGYSELPVPDPIHVPQVLETYLGGPPSALPDLYREASPVSYTSRALPPTILIQGARDHVVNPALTRTMFGKLKASGNTAFLLELPWAEHAFDAVFNGIGSQISLSYIERFLDSLDIAS
jgi:acetyl esterase/lipase